MERRQVTITWWDEGTTASLYTETRAADGTLLYAHVREILLDDATARLASREWQESTLRLFDR